MRDPSISESVMTIPTVHMAACACCLDGHTLLPDEVVTCRTCGHPCSCEGCIAEAQDGGRDA